MNFFMNFLEKGIIFFIGRTVTPQISKIIQQKDLPVLFSRLESPPHPKCVEIGCGRGFAFKSIVEYFHPQKLVAIDIEDRAIQKAKKLCEKNNWQNVEIKKADATNPPFADHSFDIIFVFSVLHHIKNWKGVIEQASRIIKPGGYLFLKEPLEGFFRTKLLNPWYRWIDRPAAFFKEEELKEELKKNNFKINFWQYRGFYKKFLKISIEGICQKQKYA